MTAAVPREVAAVAALGREIRACAVCAPHLDHPPRPIFRIHPDARIAVVGQAPGVRAHAADTPWADPSGVRLRAWMQLSDDAFYDETTVAIVPAGFCFPGLTAKGADKPPRRECAPLWHDRVFATLPRLRLWILAGAYAQKSRLGASARRTLTETVRDWRAYAPRIFPIPHPSWRNHAWIKRNPWFEADLLPALRDAVAEARS